MLPGYVVPGQDIVSNEDSNIKYTAGTGVESTANGFKSTLLGQLQVDRIEGKQELYRLSVTNKFVNPYSHIDTDETAHNSRRSSSKLPQVGDVVYAQVTRLAVQQVHLEILVVENQGDFIADSGVGWSANAVGTVHQASGTVGDLAELGEGYSAVIRLNDIRATERDKVKPEDYFRPGDIVRASVLSLGDGTNYYLSSVRNDLGVVFAKSHWGHDMVPLDWQTMVAPASGETEPRKCANPFVDA